MLCNDIVAGIEACLKDLKNNMNLFSRLFVRYYSELMCAHVSCVFCLEPHSTQNVVLTKKDILQFPVTMAIGCALQSQLCIVC